MKNNITNVTLSYCCQEDWNSFEAIDEGSKHCTTCQHRVIDFTNASAEDLARHKQAGSLCGRFKRSQLSAAFLMGLAASASLSSCSEPVLMQGTDTPQVEEEMYVEDEIMFTGIVFMEVSEEMERDSVEGVD